MVVIYYFDKLHKFTTAINPGLTSNKHTLEMEGMSLTKSTLEGDFNLSSIVIRDVNGAGNVRRPFLRSSLSKLFHILDPRHGGKFPSIPIPTDPHSIH
jgi:hypothetical protein